MTHFIRPALNSILANNEISFDFVVQTERTDLIDGTFYRLRKMQIHHGPISKQIENDAQFVHVGQNRETKGIVAAYSDCKETDHFFECRPEEKIYGSDLQCLQSLFKSDGLSNQCRGKNLLGS